MKTSKRFTISILSLVLIGVFALCMTQEANASHFRYGQLTYVKNPNNNADVEFKLVCAFRRSAYGAPVVGSVITESTGATNLLFGDGNFTPTLNFRVLQIDVANDWLLGVALEPGNNNKQTVNHLYAAGGPYLAEINTCCRSGAEVNNPGAGYRVSTLVNVNDGNNSPVVSNPVIQPIPQGVNSFFDIFASDSDPNTLLTYRWATLAEMGNVSQNPPNSGTGAATINNTTGHVVWDCSTAGQNSLWSCQVIVEDRDAINPNVIRTQVAVDFLIQIAIQCPTPAIPQISLSNGTITKGGVTQPYPLGCGTTVIEPCDPSDPWTISFTVTATEVAPDILTLTSILPDPACNTVTFNPPLPLVGSNVVTQCTIAAICPPSPPICIGELLQIIATDQCSPPNQGICRIRFDKPLPVELASFTSVVRGNDVTLNWSTATEENNARFEIERATLINGNTSDWSTVGSVAGAGNSQTPLSYSLTDRGLNAGSYSYRMKQVDFNGNFEYHNLNGEVIVGVPSRFDLLQNYPNPFNPTTNIAYLLPVDGNVNLSIYDNSGKLVSSIKEGYKTAGYYTVAFSASDLSSGIYYYKIDFSGSEKSFVKVMKMVVLK